MFSVHAATENLTSYKRKQKISLFFIFSLELSLLLVPGTIQPTQEEANSSQIVTMLLCPFHFPGAIAILPT